MSRSALPALIVNGVNLDKAPIIDVRALLTDLERDLVWRLGRDHSCTQHNGVDSGPCRTCHRRVLIVRDWLTNAPRPPQVRRARVTAAKLNDLEEWASRHARPWSMGVSSHVIAALVDEVREHRAEVTS